jgi:hypothetical protein
MSEEKSNPLGDPEQTDLSAKTFTALRSAKDASVKSIEGLACGMRSFENAVAKGATQD